MTREEAIKVLNMVEAYGLADEAKQMAIEALKAEPVPGEWIPTSERLPKLNTRQILRYSNGKISGGNYLGNRTWNIDFPDQDYFTKVTAWMPAPEEEEEKDANRRQADRAAVLNRRGDG